jgi:quinoprotein relay system zinc metallohydrolase 2
MITRRTILHAGTAVVATTFVGQSRASAKEIPLQIESVADGVFVGTGVHELNSPANGGHISNVSFVIGNDAVAVVDTGGSAGVGRALLGAIRSVTGRPVRYVINTHMHPDHVMGNAPLAAPETVFVGHAKLARALAARGERYLTASKDTLSPDAFAGTRIVPPSETVEAVKTLDLGGRILTLTARKTAHTDNDMTVRDEKTGTLFLGDLLFSTHVPTLDGSIRGWLKLLAELKNEPAARVVPGHGPAQMPWPEAMAAEARYLEAIAQDVRAMLKDGRTLNDAITSAGRSETASWLLFDEFHARNVAAAFAELEWE